MNKKEGKIDSDRLVPESLWKCSASKPEVKLSGNFARLTEESGDLLYMPYLLQFKLK